MPVAASVVLGLAEGLDLFHEHPVGQRRHSIVAGARAGERPGQLSGRGTGRTWLFWLRRAGDLALVVLLTWKAGISERSLRRRDFTVGTGLAAIGGILFLGSLATGLLWAVEGLGRFPIYAGAG